MNPNKSKTVGERDINLLPDPSIDRLIAIQSKIRAYKITRENLGFAIYRTTLPQLADMTTDEAAFVIHSWKHIRNHRI